MPRSAQDPNQGILLIYRPESAVRYEKFNGSLRRTVENKVYDPNIAVQRNWVLGQSGINWSIHQNQTGSQYVQIHTYIRHRINKKHKLENNHLFFTGIQGYMEISHEEK
jgi:hypothetical protein